MSINENNLIPVTPSQGDAIVKINDKYFYIGRPLSSQLGFITAEAGDIRTGKVGADTSGNPVTGTLDVSVGGIFDLAKVTEYVPYEPAITAVTTVTLSGLGTIAEVDRTEANGNYLVTDATKGETDWKKRIYKHESAEYYLYYYEEMEGEGYWYLGESTDGSSFLCYYTTENIASGTYDWENWDYGDTASVSVTATTTTTPATEMVLKGVYATGYANNEWTFSETETSFTGFENTPRVGCIYVVSGDKLVGNSIGVESEIVADANTVLLLNFNTDNSLLDSSSYGHTMVQSGGSATAEGYSGKAWNFNGGFLQATPVGNEFVFGTGDFTWEAYIYALDSTRQCLFAYESDVVFAIDFSYANDRRIGVFGTKSTGWSNYIMTDALELNKWYHIALVRNGNTLYCFVDGTATGYTADMTDVNVGATGQKFSIGRWGGDPSDFSARWQGYMDEIRISTIARYSV